MSDNTIALLAFLIFLGLLAAVMVSYQMFQDWLEFKREEREWEHLDHEEEQP